MKTLHTDSYKVPKVGLSSYLTCGGVYPYPQGLEALIDSCGCSVGGVIIIFASSMFMVLWGV